MGSQLPFFRATTHNILDNVIFGDDDGITHIGGLNRNKVHGWSGITHRGGLNRNKVHGWSGITVHMIQIYDDTCNSPVYYLYQLY